MKTALALLLAVALPALALDNNTPFTMPGDLIVISNLNVGNNMTIGGTLTASMTNHTHAANAITNLSSFAAYYTRRSIYSIICPDSANTTNFPHPAGMWTNNAIAGTAYSRAVWTNASAIGSLSMGAVTPPIVGYSTCNVSVSYWKLDTAGVGDIYRLQDAMQYLYYNSEGLLTNNSQSSTRTITNVGVDYLVVTSRFYYTRSEPVRTASEVFYNNIMPQTPVTTIETKPLHFVYGESWLE